MGDGQPTSPPRLSVLLLQARHPHDPTRAHELACFAEKVGLERTHLHTHDLLEGPPTLAETLAHDALLIGGSGDFYVSQRNLPQHDRTVELLLEVVVRGHPTFGSCFGYQLLVEAMGGQVIHDPSSAEVGTFALELTPEGADDPLIGALPPRFNAQFGHKDRAAAQPPGIPNLARSERNALQALRVPDQPVWATQFHPELCYRTNRERFELYRESYAADIPESVDSAALFDHSDEASSLLRRFFELVFAPA